MTTEVGSSTIVTNNRQLVDITGDVLYELYRMNKPPSLFVRGGKMVRIVRDERDFLVAEELEQDALRGILTRIEGIEFIKITSRGQIAVAPPLDVVRDILKLSRYQLPPLAGIIETPVIRPDGSTLTKPGYDDKTHLFYSPEPNLSIPEVPENPTREQLRDAINLITEPLIDFPFDSEASYANAIATLITPQIRPLIDGCSPLSLFDKPQAGTGATLLTEVVSVIATGRTAPIMTALDTDEAWRKHITSLLIRGQTIAVIDNLEGTLYTPTLAAVLTSRTWEDRVLGSSRMVILPNNITWLATGNNVRLSGDLPRRCIWIRLDAKQAQPFLAREKPFNHPHLIEWVQSNRGAILSSILTVTRAWVIAGKPEFTDISLGNFEKWCRISGGILSVMGIKGFLGNIQDMYKQADVDTPQWGHFLEALQEKFGDRPFKSSQVADAITGDADFKGVVPDSVAIKKDKDPSRVIGQAFRGKKENRYPNGLMIHDTGELAQRAVLYQIINWHKKSELIAHNSRNSECKSELGELNPPTPHGKTYSSICGNSKNNSLNSLSGTKTSELVKPNEQKLLPMVTNEIRPLSINDFCPACGSDELGLLPDGRGYYCTVCYPENYGV
jgi:hypothetical protein